MSNRLTPIITNKKKEVTILRKEIFEQPESFIAKLLHGDIKPSERKNFKKALETKSLAVIAEIKRKSPSKGQLATIANPLALANSYIAGGANALSVLTDQAFFDGSLEDLRLIADALAQQPQPILRKDFIIDEIQIAEAIVAGADAILCIVAVLGDQTRTMLERARSLNINVLVEVHDERELDIGLAAGAEIIGINNRDLTTFEVDTNRALKLIDRIPKNIIKVAESGIHSPQIAHEYYQAGFNAVLIGEALVKAPDPQRFIEDCKYG